MIREWRTVTAHLLTGFLGSGKTSLLQRLLALPDLSGTAVLINEFGEVGLDHLLVDFAAMKLVSAPAEIDVLVTENLFGDIISDLCAGLVGGLGVVPGLRGNPPARYAGGDTDHRHDAGECAELHPWCCRRLRGRHRSSTGPPGSRRFTGPVRGADGSRLWTGCPGAGRNALLPLAQPSRPQQTRMIPRTKVNYFAGELLRALGKAPTGRPT